MSEVFQVTYTAKGAERALWFGNIQSADLCSFRLLRVHPGCSPRVIPHPCWELNPHLLAAFLNKIDRPYPLPELDDKDLQKQQKEKPIKTASKVDMEHSMKRNRDYRTEAENSWK